MSRASTEPVILHISEPYGRLTALPVGPQRQISLIKDTKAVATRNLLQQCSYQKEKTRCNDFPCVLPLTYTPIGDHLLLRAELSPHDNNDRDGYYDTEYQYAQSDMWSREGSIRRPIKSRNNECVFPKETYLGRMAFQIKREPRVSKMADWEIRYGGPITHRAR
ncbi:uncharacterized protein [Watersipora subatra]|uniref:uncharacterized protein n=1 Tax=Watersipora subatra TaxID=2589382 RepID=UPI00355B00C6